MHLYWQMLYTKFARENAEAVAAMNAQANLQTVLFLAFLNQRYPKTARPVVQ